MSGKTSEFSLSIEMSAPVSIKNTSSFTVATFLKVTNIFWLRLIVRIFVVPIVGYLKLVGSFPKRFGLP